MRVWGKTTKPLGFLFTPVLLSALAATSFAVNGDSGKEPASQLVREVVDQEIRSTNTDHSRWKYRQHHIDPRSDVVKECVETKQGVICRLVAVAGHPLSQAQERAELQHLQELLNNPRKLQEENKARRQDADHALKMLKVLPDAFEYEYDGMEGENLRLRFQPDPNFNPPDRETRVFHAMVGCLLVAPKSKRLVAIKGTLVKDVDFGFGLLGHLDKGGTFEVRRREVEEGIWETTRLDVSIRGKAMFFKTINAQQHEVTDDFKKVPPALTIAQAVSMLQVPSLQARSAAPNH
jgi:hypothetical protein